MLRGEFGAAPSHGRLKIEEEVDCGCQRAIARGVLL
jgi:hypothetical protein